MYVNYKHKTEYCERIYLKMIKSFSEFIYIVLSVDEVLVLPPELSVRVFNPALCAFI